MGDVALCEMIWRSRIENMRAHLQIIAGQLEGGEGVIGWAARQAQAGVREADRYLSTPPKEAVERE